MCQYSDIEFNNIYKAIKRRLTYGIFPSKTPQAYILGGQPGAGKTILQRILLNKNENTIVINADDFRKSHPYYNLIQKKYGNVAQNYTQQFINKIVEQLIDELSSKKYNLIIEGTLRTVEVPLKTCAMLKNRDYYVELDVIAVNKFLSYESTILRYENAISIGEIPRATSKQHHDLVVKMLPSNLDDIYFHNIFDEIQMFDRYENCVYNTSLHCSPSIVEKQILYGKLSNEDIKQLYDVVSSIVMLKTQRNAGDLQEYNMHIKALYNEVNKLQQNNIKLK